MGLEDNLTQAEISMFESGRCIPSLLVLHEYAEVAGVWMDAPTVDDIDLPEKLPAKAESFRKHPLAVMANGCFQSQARSPFFAAGGARTGAGRSTTRHARPKFGRWCCEARPASRSGRDAASGR